MGENTMIPVKKATREKLRSITYKSKSYDKMINELIDLHIKFTSETQKRLFPRDHAISELLDYIEIIERYRLANPYWCNECTFRTDNLMGSMRHRWEVHNDEMMETLYESFSQFFKDNNINPKNYGSVLN